MFSLSFRRDPDELRDLPTDPTTADIGDLELILMRQHVRLLADNIVILDTLVPLLYMAGGLALVKNLHDEGTAELGIPEGSLKLTFHRRGDNVTIREFIYSTEGSGTYQQLVEEWERFSQEARSYLLSEFPELRNHPQVGDWFRQDSG